MPSAGEFLHEFIGHFVALEGKLWGTLALLLFRPGSLTAEYLAGRRVRRIQPLRLYLTLSVLFFALIKYGASDAKLFQTDAEPAPVSISTMAPATAASAPDGVLRQDREDANDTLRAEEKLSKLAPSWGPKLARFWHLNDAEKTHIISSAFLEYVPYAMFCMLPLFALYLKLLYLGTGKRYGEHLLFALHCNAFAFVLFGLITLAPWGGLKLLLFIWLVCYLPVAMRRVYGGGRLATAARWLVLTTTHMLVMCSAIAGTLLLAVVH